MSNYLLFDTEDNTIPITRIVASDRVDALLKCIKGLINDEILTVEDICADLGIDLREITNIKTYE